MIFIPIYILALRYETLLKKWLKGIELEIMAVRTICNQIPNGNWTFLMLNMAAGALAIGVASGPFY